MTAVAALLSAAGFALAAGTAPARPAGAAAPDIAFETAVLSNGLRVIVAPDPSVSVAAVAMGFPVGSRTEPRGRGGYAHLMEYLMFEGSKHVPKGGFDRILESYGGDNNAASRVDFTVFHEVLPARAFPVALWLDADRFGDLDVPKAALAAQVEILKNERRMRADNVPYGTLLRVEIASRSFSNWHNAHPAMGTFEDFDAVTPKAVDEFYSSQYAPRNGVLAIAGAVEPAAAMRWARDYFERIPDRPAPAPVDASEPKPGAGGWIALSDPHARLPALAVSWRDLPERRTPDYYALVLVAQALFEGKGSRLYEELVKGSGAAVSVEGGLGFPLVDDPLEFKTPGLLTGFVVHKAEHSALKVRALVDKAVARAAAKGLAPAELERLKTDLRARWIRGQGTCLGRAQMLLRGALLDGDPGSVNVELARFMAVSTEDTRRAAARYLRPEAALFFAVSPGGAP